MPTGPASTISPSLSRDGACFVGVLLWPRCRMRHIPFLHPSNCNISLPQDRNCNISLPQDRNAGKTSTRQRTLLDTLVLRLRRCDPLAVPATPSCGMLSFCVCVCVRARVHGCMPLCVCVCVLHARERALLCVCGCAFVRISVCMTLSVSVRQCLVMAFR